MTEKKQTSFRHCYEPHLRDYPDCLEECGCDSCEAPKIEDEEEEQRLRTLKQLQ
jgi:hypothetical protein